MKKVIYFAFLFVVLFSFQPAFAINCITLENNLYPGARDRSVSTLQSFLQSTGDYTDSQISGYFGLSTQQAVQRFQKRNGIVSSGAPGTTGYGAVGPTTRKAINASCSTTPSVVESVQTTANPVAVSVSSPQSSSATNGEITITRTLTLRSRGDDVRALQEFLKTEGDYTYPEVTGYFGPVTQEAVQRFQARVGVVNSGSPQTTGYGLVGPSTRRALMQEMSESVAVNNTSSAPNPTPASPPSINTPSIQTPVPTIIPSVVPVITPINRPPTPSVSPLSQQEYVPGVQISASPSQIKRGESSKVSWSSNYATSCKGNFAEKEGTYIEVPTAGSIIVSPLWSFTYRVECTSSSGRSASAVVEVKIPQVLLESQINGIKHLLQSFGVSSGAVADVEAILRGKAPTSTDYLGIELSDAQIDAILALLSNFGADKITIGLVKEVLARGSGIDRIPERSPQVRLTVSSPIVMAGESVNFTWDSDDALVCTQPIRANEKGEVDWSQHLGYTAGPTKGATTTTPYPSFGWSDFRGFAKYSWMVGCRGLFYPDEIATASVSIELKKEEQTPKVPLQLIIDSTVRSAPAFVKDSSRGNLLYFAGGKNINGVYKQGVFVATNCPNNKTVCSNTQLVIDEDAVGFSDIDDVSIVQMTDSTNTGRSYYIMYLSGLEKELTSATSRGFYNTYYSTSWVGDGVNWSKPQLLLAEHHSPSVVRENGDSGEVLLFTNSATQESVVMHRLGLSGIVPSAPSIIHLPTPEGGGYYRHVDVQYGCEKSCYHLLRAIRYGSSEGHSFIDTFIKYAGNTKWSSYVLPWRPHENASLHGVHVPMSLNTGLAYLNTHRYFIADGGKIYAIDESKQNSISLAPVMKAFSDAFSRGVQSLANTLTGFFGATK